MNTIKTITGTNWQKSKTPIKIDTKRQINGYGMELVLNLYDCNLKKISTKKYLNDFVVILCEKVIKMKRYGEAIIPNFGHDNPITSGYSLVQLIETSSIVGHFSDAQRSCYLDIFSCAYYDPQKTAEFCKEYFEAREMDAFLIKRI